VAIPFEAVTAVLLLHNLGNVAGYLLTPAFAFIDFSAAGIHVDKLTATGEFRDQGNGWMDGDQGGGKGS
jgi:hypothetical protein